VQFVLLVEGVLDGPQSLHEQKQVQVDVCVALQYVNVLE